MPPFSFMCCFHLPLWPLPWDGGGGAADGGVQGWELSSQQQDSTSALPKCPVFLSCCLENGNGKAWAVGLGEKINPGQSREEDFILKKSKVTARSLPRSKEGPDWSHGSWECGGES